MNIRNVLIFSVDCITQSELISVIVFPFWKNKIKHNKIIHTDFPIHLLYKMVVKTVLITICTKIIYTL